MSTSGMHRRPFEGRHLVPDIWPDAASLLDSAKLAIQLFYIATKY